MADSLPPASAAAQLRDWPAWPDYALVDDLLPVLEGWAAQNRRFALASLIEVVGSSPRPVGSEMAIADDGEVAGYVSGGCVEAAVAVEALAALADGRPRLLDYGAGSPVLDVQLSCGGRIRILVRAIDDGRDYVRRLREARRARRSIEVVTELASGAMQFREALPGASSGLARDDAGKRFVQLHLPALRLTLVGGDPICLALTRMAPPFGIEVQLLRPLGPDAAPPRLPQLDRYDRRGIGAALADLRLDRYSAVYTLSHDADTDHAVLMLALNSEAFAVGALGSRRKAELRRARLREAGIGEAQLERLRTPAGLDIGARTPQEIALSILGQIIEQRPR